MKIMQLKKPIVTTMNRHKTFRTERMSGVKKNLEVGRYHKLLPRKKPRNFKKMKAPFEVYKDETIRKVIKHLFDLYEGRINRQIDNSNVTKENLLSSFLKLRNKLSSKGIDIYNNSGKDLHVLLPLSGMSPVGYFYKAIFERLLPEARVTFLKTYARKFRFSSPNTLKNIADIDLMELKKSINVNDKIFVLIDFISIESKTKTIISNNLSKLNKNYDLISVNSPESYYNDIPNLMQEIKHKFHLINEEDSISNDLVSSSLRDVDSERIFQKKEYEKRFFEGKEVYRQILAAYAKKYNKGKILKFSEIKEQAKPIKFELEDIFRTIPNSQVYKLQTPLEKYDPKLFNFLKKLDSAKAYTYYYLGSEFVREAMREKLR